MLMPLLEKGREYRWKDKPITETIAPDDADDFRNCQCHHNEFDNIVLKYAELSMGDLREQIEKMRRDYYDVPLHKNKVMCIKDLIQAGKRACPVFIGENDLNRDIKIGNHRAIAFLELSAPFIPVLFFRDG